MSLPSKIIKRCDRCDRQFEIPNMRISPARDLMIEYFPCGHCGYVKPIPFPKSSHRGRCRGCRLPFQLVGHRAKGRCNRCLMRVYRKAPPSGEPLR